MKKETITIKIYKETLPKLRLLAALRGERMVKLVDRVIDQELKKEGGKNEKSLSLCAVLAPRPKSSRGKS